MIQAFKNLWRWVQRSFGKPQPEGDRTPTRQLIKQSATASLYEDKIRHPGTVKAWVVVRDGHPAELVLNLVGLPELRQDFALGKMFRRDRGQAPFVMRSDREFDEQLAEYLRKKKMQRNHSTHILVVFWKAAEPRDFGGARGYTIRPIIDIPADLQNGKVDINSAYAIGNKPAIQIVASMGVNLLKWADTHSAEDWRHVGDRYEWLWQLRMRAKNVFYEGHEIQRPSAPD